MALKPNTSLYNDGGGGKSSAQLALDRALEQASNRNGMSSGRTDGDGTVNAPMGQYNPSRQVDGSLKGKSPTVPPVTDGLDESQPPNDPKNPYSSGKVTANFVGSGSGTGSSSGGGVGGNSNASNSVTNIENHFNDLKNRYNDMLRQTYDFNAEKLKAERDAALREQYISQRQTEASLPERLAALGVTGGAANSTLANLWATYQGNRNKTRAGYLNNLGDLMQDYQQGVAENAINYDSRYLNHLLELALMDKEFEQNKILKSMS